jgi:hypothetical protein
MLLDLAPAIFRKPAAASTPPLLPVNLAGALLLSTHQVALALDGYEIDATDRVVIAGWEWMVSGPHAEARVTFTPTAEPVAFDGLLVIVGPAVYRLPLDGPVQLPAGASFSVTLTVDLAGASGGQPRLRYGLAAPAILAQATAALAVSAAVEAPRLRAKATATLKVRGQAWDKAAEEGLVLLMAAAWLLEEEGPGPALAGWHRPPSPAASR